MDEIDARWEEMKKGGREEMRVDFEVIPLAVIHYAAGKCKSGRTTQIRVCTGLAEIVVIPPRCQPPQQIKYRLNEFESR